MTDSRKESDSLGVVEVPADKCKFTGKYEHRTVAGGIGHNLPQEAPQALAQAVIDVGRF